MGVVNVLDTCHIQNLIPPLKQNEKRHQEVCNDKACKPKNAGLVNAHGASERSCRKRTRWILQRGKRDLREELVFGKVFYKRAWLNKSLGGRWDITSTKKSA